MCNTRVAFDRFKQEIKYKIQGLWKNVFKRLYLSVSFLCYMYFELEQRVVLLILATRVEHDKMSVEMYM